MDDLFDSPAGGLSSNDKNGLGVRTESSNGSASQSIPLAERLRPSVPSEVVGQRHLLGEGKPLSSLFQSGKIHSLILWGPPGVGKTTLARVLANSAKAKFLAISAVFAGVKDIREATKQAEVWAQAGHNTILFVDEIHRFNKSQQDALLPFVESGLITFIGATTENPAFEVNSALLSRAQVYVLEPLGMDEFRLLLNKALSLENQQLELTEAAFSSLCEYADGDGRRFLNMLQIVLERARQKHTECVDVEFLADIAPSQMRRFDKGGDAFYDQISALHKSVRGSDPDAALYWFCRMLDGGADPRYLARRIVRMAWEDIGLADPRAMQMCNDAASTYERLGSPEGELALAQAVLYLAVAAKSNAGYKAFNKAMAFVKGDQSRPVPNHLRNAPTKLAKELGHGKDYRYSQEEPDAFSAGQTYLPDGVENPNWYQPTDRGLESKIAEKLNYLKSLSNK